MKFARLKFINISILAKVLLFLEDGNRQGREGGGYELFCYSEVSPSLALGGMWLTALVPGWLWGCV